jgi:microcystin-dependent protein
MYAGQGATVDFNATTGRGLGRYRKFALCNGNIHSVSSGGSVINVTTPDLMNRFVIGGKPNGVTSAGRLIGVTGGSETHTLTLAEMPKHNHLATFAGSPLANHQHEYHGPGGSDISREGYVSAGGGVAQVNDPFEKDDVNAKTSLDSAGTPSGTVTVNNTGGTITSNCDPHNNMPPFYALAYIMRIE